SKYLFKLPTEGTGGHWAEYIASEIGKGIGFNTVNVFLAKDSKNIGTISRNFRLNSSVFYEGGDLFLGSFSDFDRESLNHYELPNILNILDNLSLTEEFVFVPVFDTLIANNDRHCDNWGVLQQQDFIKLAPIYDNGSSLGFNVKPSKMSQMLTDNRMLEGFCNRGKSCIGLPQKKKPKHFQLLLYLQEEYPHTIKEAMELVNNLNVNLILKVLNTIPNEVMSDLEKSWVQHLLMYRKKWILNWYERSAN